MDEISQSELEHTFKKYYGLKDVNFEYLNTLVNDIFLATTPNRKFALKLYHEPYRTETDVQWEVDLILHLIKNGAPVMKPVIGKNGYIHTFLIKGKYRIGVLYEWALGEKPKPNVSTYILLGKAGAQIHQAADTFSSKINREQYDSEVLIDEQLQRMKNHLIEVNRWEQIYELGERLKKLIINQELDKGICHMDLTLDNIHCSGDTITVFDFDSAGESWRAIEPYGVLMFSKDYFKGWLDGYRSVRPFNKKNENAVAAFVIIGDLRNVVWKLGLANSSRGKPLLTSHELPEVIDEWLRWEDQNILYH